MFIYSTLFKILIKIQPVLTETALIIKTFSSKNKACSILLHLKGSKYDIYKDPSFIL